MKNKNIITGYTGSLGPSIVKALLNRNQETAAVARDIEKAKKYSENFEGLVIEKGDARNYSEMDNIMKDAKTLFYCINVPYKDWEENARELLAVSIDACIKNDVKLIFPGNVYIYGLAEKNPVDENHPLNAHTKKGKIRIDMENMLKEASEKRGLKYTIVRFPDFYGPFVINNFYDKIFINALTGKPIMWIGNLDTEIEYIFIEDAGEAMVNAGLSDSSTNKIFNVPGYKETTAREFLQEVSMQGGKKSKIRTLNSDFLFNVIGLFNPVVSEVKEMLYLKRTRLILDGSFYKETFGNLPATPYPVGIRKTFDWAREFYNIK